MAIRTSTIDASAQPGPATSSGYEDRRGRPDQVGRGGVPDVSGPWTRHRVEEAIEENGGPKGLMLAGADLSGLVLNERISVASYSVATAKKRARGRLPSYGTWSWKARTLGKPSCSS